MATKATKRVLLKMDSHLLSHLPKKLYYGWNFVLWNTVDE